jgi:hypothetical protein
MRRLRNPLERSLWKGLGMTNESNIIDDTAIVEMAVGERDLEITAIRNSLTIIDGVLKDIGNTNICSSSEMTDSLLDLRNLLKPLLD